MRNDIKFFIEHSKEHSEKSFVLEYSLRKHGISKENINFLNESKSLDKIGNIPNQYARYLVPFLCNYTGRAVYLTDTWLCINTLTSLFHGLQVITEKTSFNYNGSFIYFNNDQCKTITPDIIQHQSEECLVNLLHSIGQEFSYFPYIAYDITNSITSLVQFTYNHPCKFNGKMAHPERKLWMAYLYEASAAD